jgi:hypothetical protein
MIIIKMILGLKVQINKNDFITGFYLYVLINVKLFEIKFYCF